MSSLLFGVSPLDPLTYLAVSAILFVAAVSATYLPARRATQLDPIVTLRQQ
jgi:ABC-type lipoprotein release transport system permease subunit